VQYPQVVKADKRANKVALTTEDAIKVAGRAPIRLTRIRPVGDQAALGNKKGYG
jgi:hypothetical protein